MLDEMLNKNIFRLCFSSKISSNILFLFNIFFNILLLLTAMSEKHHTCILYFITRVFFYFIILFFILGWRWYENTRKKEKSIIPFQNSIRIPPYKLLPDSERFVKVLRVFFGDDASILKPELLKLYPSQSLTPEKRVFNYRLNRRRRRRRKILANRCHICHTVIMLDPPVFRDNFSNISFV